MRASSGVLRSLRLVAAIAYTCASLLTAGCEIHVDIVDAGAADGGEPDSGDAGNQQDCPRGEFDDDGRPQTPCVAYAVCQPGEYVSREASPTEDRICSACKSGSFSTEQNASACQLWSNCPPGSYSENTPNSTSDRACSPCTDGTGTRGPNESLCHSAADCPAGTVRTEIDGELKCEACAPGGYCPGGGRARENCASDAWDHDANPATECVQRTICLPGQYVALEGDASNDRQCAACSSGSVSLDVNAASCQRLTQCQPGEYISVAGSARADRACSPCAADSFSSTANATSCEIFRTCEPGSFVYAEGTSTSDRVCVGCASGYYSTEPNSPQCQKWSTCGPGTHVLNEPSSSEDRRCEACEPGTITEGDDWTLCIPQGDCLAGTFAVVPSDGDNPPECGACATGYYCAGANNIIISCEGGTWDHDADPSTACVTRSACLAGQYVIDDGDSVRDRKCSPCPEGTFSSSINEPQCTAWSVCPAGSYVSQPGSALNDRICVPCPTGSFSTANNANSCTRQSDCLPGQFVSAGSDATSDRVCTGCSSGTFSALANQLECAGWRTCEAGEYMTNTPSSVNDRACARCPEGSFSEQANQSSCTTADACRPGSVETVPGTASNAPTCEACEPGTYCAGNQSLKVPCPPGTWDHDLNSATSCVPQTLCASGQYATSVGDAIEDHVCGACEAGSFSEASNVATCTPWTTCPPGSYVSHAGDAKTDRSCEPCAPGSFSTQDNSSMCSVFRNCAAGQRIAAEGTAASDRVCIDCSAGTYSNVANATTCSAWTTCTAGSYASSQGSSTSDRVCVECAAGSFSAADNAPQCDAWATCQPGTYVAQFGSTSSNRVCQGCAAGSFSIADNTLMCTAFSECGQGMYISSEGTSTSDRMCAPRSDCQPGTYVNGDDDSGDRNCSACAEGTFSTSVNASACAAWSTCPAGTFVSTSPNAARDRGCGACPDGTFSASNNRSACSAWRICGPDEEVSVPGTSTSDVECMQVQAPMPNFLWLDAGDSATITKGADNRVSEWRDKSGRNRHASVPAGSDAPLWRGTSAPGGRAEIEFNGSNVRLQTASVATAPEMTIFVVFNLSEPEEWGSILNQGQNMYYSIRLSETAQGQLNWHIGPRDDAPLLPPNIGAYQLLTTMQSAGVASMYYYPSQAVTTSVANISAGSAPITIGNGISGAESMGGTIGEIRAYDYVLSSAQRDAVERELKAKYMLGRTSCADIFTHNSAAPSGRYTIDPDGTGNAAPITVECDMTQGGWQVIATDRFESIPTGWMPITRSSCGSFGNILGGVGTFRSGTTAQKTYNLGGQAHSEVRLSLDFIKIGAWDEEDAIVTVDDEEFFTETFGADDGPNSQCGSPAPELSYHKDMAFDHSAGTLTLKVTTTLDDDDESEAFAIDNVIVRIR